MTRRAADAQARAHICAPRTSDLRYEQRALDFLGVVVGRALVVERLVLLHVADAEGQHLLHGRPVGRDRLQKRLEVCGADDIHAAAVKVRREGEPCQRGVTWGAGGGGKRAGSNGGG